MVPGSREMGSPVKSTPGNLGVDESLHHHGPSRRRADQSPCRAPVRDHAARPRIASPSKRRSARRALLGGLDAEDGLELVPANEWVAAVLSRRRSIAHASGAPPSCSRHREVTSSTTWVGSSAASTASRIVPGRLVEALLGARGCELRSSALLHRLACEDAAERIGFSTANHAAPCTRRLRVPRAWPALPPMRASARSPARVPVSARHLMRRGSVTPAAASTR